MVAKTRLRVLGISASPRHGNSEFLLKVGFSVLKSLQFGVDIEDEIYSFAGKRFSPCVGCLSCLTNGGFCIVKDGFQELQPKWLEADVIVYSVPLYVMNIPGQLKCFFDRLCNSQYGDKANSVKKLNVSAVIAQGGSHSAGQESAIQELQTYTVVTGGIPVAASAHSSYTGVRGWTRHDLNPGVLAARLAAQDAEVVEVVEQAKDLVTQAVLTACIVSRGAEAMQDVLDVRPEYRSLVRRTASRR